MTNLIPAWIDGTLTPADKLAVHLAGHKHLAVSVFVISGSETLIQKRAAGKYHTPGLWANTCCTHPDWDEPTLDCATRRLDQELGIKGLVCTLAHKVEYKADVGNQMTEHELVDVFVSETTKDLEIKPDPEEVADYRWISLDDLMIEVAQTPEAFTPWLRIYLRDHLKPILGSNFAK